MVNFEECSIIQATEHPVIYKWQSSYGKLLALNCENEVKLYDITGNEKDSIRLDARCVDLSWSANGALLAIAVAGSSKVIIWNFHSKVCSEVCCRENINLVAWSKVEAKKVALFGDNSYASLYDVADNSHSDLQIDSSALCCEWDEISFCLAVGCTGSIYVFQNNGENISRHETKGATSQVKFWDRSHKVLVSYYCEQTLWVITEGLHLPFYKIGDGETLVSYAWYSGKLFLICSDNTLFVIDDINDRTFEQFHTDSALPKNKIELGTDAVNIDVIGDLSEHIVMIATTSAIHVQIYEGIFHHKVSEMKTLLEGKIEDKIVAVDWFAKRYLFTILDKSHKLHVYQDSALFKERNDHDATVLHNRHCEACVSLGRLSFGVVTDHIIEMRDHRLESTVKYRAEHHNNGLIKWTPSMIKEIEGERNIQLLSCIMDRRVTDYELYLFGKALIEIRENVEYCDILSKIDEMHSVLLAGCELVTDTGLQMFALQLYRADINLTGVHLANCLNITEDGIGFFHYFFRTMNLCYRQGTNISVRHKKISKHSVEGCPFVSEERSDNDTDLFPRQHNHVRTAIVHASEVQFSVMMRMSHNQHIEMGEANSIIYSKWELDSFILPTHEVTYPQFLLSTDLLHSHSTPSVVIIPFHSTDHQICNRLVQLISYFASKEQISLQDYMYNINIDALFHKHERVKWVDKTVVLQPEGQSAFFVFKKDVGKLFSQVALNIKQVRTENIEKQLTVIVFAKLPDESLSKPYVSIEIGTSFNYKMISFGFKTTQLEENEEAEFYISDGLDESIIRKPWKSGFKFGVCVTGECSSITVDSSIFKICLAELWMSTTYILVDCAFDKADGTKTELMEGLRSKIDDLTGLIDSETARFRPDALNDQHSSIMSLIKTKEVLQNLVSSGWLSHRLKYVTLGESNEDFSELRASVQSMCEAECGRYSNHISFLDNGSLMIKELLSDDVIVKRVWLRKDIHKKILSKRQLFYEIDINHLTHVLCYLHNKGLLIYFPNSTEPLVIVDVKWFTDLLVLLQNAPKEVKPLDYSQLPYITENTILWKDTDLLQLVDSEDGIDDIVMWRAILDLLIESGQLLRLIPNREDISDAKNIYVNFKHLHDAPIPLDYFTSNNNTVQVDLTYTFHNIVTDIIWRTVVNSLMCYVMPICFGDTYFVFHHGACEGVLQKNCEHGEQIILTLKIFNPTADSAEHSAEQQHLIYLLNLFESYCEIIGAALLTMNVGYSKVISKDKSMTMIDTKLHRSCTTGLHIWHDDPASIQQKITSICTWCNNCTNMGRSCPYNRLPYKDYKYCLCDTKNFGCFFCGICKTCATLLQGNYTSLRNNHLNQTLLTRRRENKIVPANEDDLLRKNLFVNSPMYDDSLHNTFSMHVQNDVRMTFSLVGNGHFTAMRKRYCIFFPNHGDCKMMNHASEFAAKQIETTERQMKLSDKIELSIKHHKAVETTQVGWQSTIITEFPKYKCYNCAFDEMTGKIELTRNHCVLSDGRALYMGSDPVVFTQDRPFSTFIETHTNSSVTIGVVTTDYFDNFQDGATIGKEANLASYQTPNLFHHGSKFVETLHQEVNFDPRIGIQIAVKNNNVTFMCYMGSQMLHEVDISAVGDCVDMYLAISVENQKDDITGFLLLELPEKISEDLTGDDVPKDNNLLMNFTYPNYPSLPITTSNVIVGDDVPKDNNLLINFTYPNYPSLPITTSNVVVVDTEPKMNLDATISLKNASESHSVVYKMKITNPEDFSVEPNIAVIETSSAKESILRLLDNGTFEKHLTKLRIEYVIVKPPVELPDSWESGDKSIMGWFNTVDKKLIHTVTVPIKRYSALKYSPTVMPKVSGGPINVDCFELKVTLNAFTIYHVWIPVDVYTLYFEILRASENIPEGNMAPEATDEEFSGHPYQSIIVKSKNILPQEYSPFKINDIDNESDFLLTAATNCTEAVGLCAPTVTEIALRRKMPAEWKKVYLGKNLNIYIRLPSGINSTMLRYPTLGVIMDTYKMNYHKMCMHFKDSVENSVYFHLMDNSGVTTTEDVEGQDFLRKSLLYRQLLLAKIALPSYKYLLHNTECSRKQMELYMTTILEKYSRMAHLLFTDQDHKTDLYWTARSVLDSCRVDANEIHVRPGAINCDAHDFRTTDYSSNEELASAIGPYQDLIYRYVVHNDIELRFVKNFSSLNHLMIEDLDVSTDTGRCLSELKQLSKLIITRCKNFNYFLQNINACDSLQTIIIKGSDYSELPEAISSCACLKTLKFIGGKYPDLPTLKGCTLLENLYINRISIRDIPSTFALLQNLVTLNITATVSGTQFGSVEYQNYVAEEQSKDNIKSKIEFYNDLFHEEPRLGMHITEDNRATGGIPPAIFQLQSLQHFYLSEQFIRFIPPHISKLKNLVNLTLRQCLLLTTLHENIAELKYLQDLRIERCPSLASPSPDIVARGSEATIAYLQRLRGGHAYNYRTKLMLVGLGGAGKTSLLRALMDKKPKKKSEETLTDGIDILTWKLKHNNKEITYSAWDFAGQTVYYNTHQFFLSNRAVYILVWNTRLGYEHAGLDFWLSSIRCHAPKTPIFIVGTFADQVAKTEIPSDALLKSYPQIRGFYHVASTTGFGVCNLRDDLAKITLKESYMGEEVPLVYLTLENSIKRSRNDTKVLSFKEVKEKSTTVGICEVKDIQRALQFLHDLGTIQYFDNDFLRDHIVIDPQWIVDVMAAVVSVTDSKIKEGRFYHSDMGAVWHDQPEDLHEWLLRLTESFDLTFPHPDQPYNLVPCLLPHSPPLYDWPTVTEGTKETFLVYKFAYLPTGLFNRIQVRLFQFSSGRAIWKHGSMLVKNTHYAVIQQTSDNKLCVRVHGTRPENILFLIHESIETLINDVYEGISYDYLVPCPDCLLKTVDLPISSLIEASLIRKACYHNAPFLQCREYFHTVSMNAIQALLPPDSNDELEFHIDQSVHALEDIRSMFSTDIYISYCMDDVPTDPTTNIGPHRLVRDLTENGYTCWFRENIDDVSVHDQIMALQDSKLLVVMMSESYVNNEQCAERFIYATENCSKPYIIVCVGQNRNWQTSAIGLKIGQEVYVDMKNINLYDKKLQLLLQGIEVKLSILNKKSLGQHKNCFISYAWQNSKDAVAKGTKPVSGSVGAGDPREVKSTLESHGYTCWLDIEQTGKAGLFEDIRQGLLNCDMLIACISNEYELSRNCMMEFRFGVCTLNIPTVIVSVGTGDHWMVSEIGMFMVRNNIPRIELQTVVDAGKIEQLLTNVKKKMLETKQTRNIESTSKAEIAPEPELDAKELMFKEEYELAHMVRHITAVSSSIDSISFPNLIVLDFVSATAYIESSVERITSARVRSASKKRQPEESEVMDVEINYVAENFCVKLFCEYEQGWHSQDIVTNLEIDDNSRNIRDLIVECAPYLSKCYSIIKHSGISLNCMSGENGERFQTFINEHSDGNINNAYRILRQLSIHAKVETLKRCHLPTGKISWLCLEHRQGTRVTILTNDILHHNALHGMNNYIEVRDFLVSSYPHLQLMYPDEKIGSSKTGEADDSSETNSKVRSSTGSASSSKSRSSARNMTEPSSLESPMKQHKQQRLKSAEAKRRMPTNLSKEALQVTGNAMADSPGLKGGLKGRAKSVACVVL